MDLRLVGKRVVVTGSSSGIGEATARLLAAEGATVLIHGRRNAAVSAVVTGIRSDGGEADGIVVDLEAGGAPERIMREADRLLGGVDILVNNAGAGYGRSWDALRADDWRLMYQTHVVAAAHLAHLAVPGMRERGWGRIIQVASSAATRPPATMPEYSAAKAALVSLTVSLAQALNRTGVTVNTISPGTIVTPRSEAALRHAAARNGWGEEWPEIEQSVLREVMDNPVGRLGTAAEVACLVAFLASPVAGYVNGANYRIDGGATAVVN